MVRGEAGTRQGRPHLELRGGPCYGPVEFFADEARLREVVSRLTDLHEGGRPEPWAVTDAPEAFVEAQLRGIVGLRLPITRIEGKRKLSQNRPQVDRQGVAEGLQGSERESERRLAAMIPRDIG